MKLFKELRQRSRRSILVKRCEDTSLKQVRGLIVYASDGVKRSE